MATQMAGKIPAQLDSPRASGPVPSSAQVSTPSTLGLSAVEVGFLQDTRDYPDSGVANRYKRLGISVRQGQKLKARLARQELINDTLETTKTGSIRTVRLTEKGEQLLLEAEKAVSGAQG